MLSKDKIYYKKLNHIVLCAIFLFFPNIRVHAGVFAEMNLSKNSVYVQEPFRVTITVYTTTWFTAPLEFKNLQIPNAFIVPFDKTQPGMFGSGNKQYPGVQFYYIVFPYQPGEFTIPAFDITAHSPAEGSATPSTVVVHTPERKFTVRDVPQKLKEQDAWLVAKNVTIKESWSPALTNLKVGDVIQRIIVVDAKGTLPQFIPDISGQEKVKWASTYPEDVVLTDLRSGGDANGRSTQTVTYLLEQKGNFKLPKVKIAYWDPVTSKIMDSSTSDIEIAVADNPNLGILKTLKDSLNATQKPNDPNADTKGVKRIWGIKWYSFFGLVAASIVLLFYLVKWIRWISAWIKKRRAMYLHTEKYYFHQMMRAGENPREFLTALYTWWDHIRVVSSASITKSLAADQEKGAQLIQAYMEDVCAGKTPENANEIKQFLRKFREKIKKSTIEISGKERKLSDRQKLYTK